MKECKIQDQFYRFQHGDLQVEFLEDGCNTEIVIMTIKYLIYCRNDGLVSVIHLKAGEVYCLVECDEDLMKPATFKFGAQFYYPGLHMEPANFSEIANFYQTTPRHVAEGIKRDKPRSNKFKSPIRLLIPEKINWNTSFHSSLESYLFSHAVNFR